MAMSKYKRRRMEFRYAMLLAYSEWCYSDKQEQTSWLVLFYALSPGVVVITLDLEFQ